MVTNRQRYREKVSQMISWGHWFALFNILFALILGSRYLLVADWPSSLAGRIYAYSSWVGHFSFIVFAAYLLIIFPLTFVVMSQRLLRVISAVVATAGLTLVMVDSAVFSRFHLHLNPVVWELVINPDQSEMARDWQLMFISVPLIFLVQMLFATWSWQKLRSLNRRSFGKPVAALFISAFFASHLMYIWADANFYRPITMQRANLPLSYPMTARRFLERHGLLDAHEYQRRLVQQGDPEAVSVEYPLSEITFRDAGTRNNLLVLTVDGLNNATLAKALPQLNQFASENVRFTQHYSAGDTPEKGLFGLFYGISSSYMNGILASRTPSALLGALSTQGYQFGLFSSEGFNPPLYRQALLTDYSMAFQDVVLFDDTVMENIRLGKRGATDQEVRAAAEAANCGEFIRRLPQGYDTPIGENGAKLSGGERQRISIARALLKNAPIVLLDEATASLDVENETKVQGALSRLLAGKTVLVIAHRMRTVAGADHIVVLENGRVAEQGTPAELMEKVGLYRRMVELQSHSAQWQLNGNE